MDLADMLVAMKRNSDDALKILPEAAIMRLREAGARYAEYLRGPRFKVGELVTPVADGDIKGAGDPHLVVEVRHDVEPDFSSGDVNSSMFGKRIDVRILGMGGDSVYAHWVESYGLEYYQGSGS